MKLDINDRWHAAFVPGLVGRHYFTIEAWSDDFAALRRDIEIIATQQDEVELGLQLLSGHGRSRKIDVAQGERIERPVRASCSARRGRTRNVTSRPASSRRPPK